MHKLLTTLILTILSLYLSATVRVTNLSIEGRQDSPLGIDVKTPSLGWRLMADDGLFRVCQTQYHILVASSELLLSQDKGDIWDHTTVSDQSQWIPFCGKKLSPNAKYWWKVRAEYSYSSSIDGKKTKKAWTEWSAPSSWSMGLMHEYRWKGYWIGMEHANPWDREDEHSRLSARYFRRT
ncbi:MAG: alpha-rhamnosidase, partial [Prevotella sp.]|nr:alpha-rhamnosidase [Prevotella sp.]